MAGSLDLKIAERRGSQVAAEFGFTSFPIDPRVIASKRNIIVDVKPLVSCHGCLMKTGYRFGILYSTKLTAPGAVNFTIAHELGHYFLDGHAEALFPHGSGRHESQSLFSSSDPREREADSFAVGLLLPEDHFIAATDEYSGGWQAIDALVERCKTSRTATAIRYATLSASPVAVISATAGKIDFCSMSDSLKSWHGISWLRKGTPIPSGTATHDLITQSTGKVGTFRKDDTSDFATWFSDGPEVQCHEEAIVFGDYGTSLTVLWTDAALDGDEDDQLDFDAY